MTDQQTMFSQIEDAIFAHLTHKWQTGGEIVRALGYAVPEADVLQVATVLLNVSVIQRTVESESINGIVYYRLPTQEKQS